MKYHERRNMIEYCVQKAEALLNENPLLFPHGKDSMKLGKGLPVLTYPEKIFSAIFAIERVLLLSKKIQAHDARQVHTLVEQEVIQKQHPSLMGLFNDVKHLINYYDGGMKSLTQEQIDMACTSAKILLKETIKIANANVAGLRLTGEPTTEKIQELTDIGGIQ